MKTAVVQVPVSLLLDPELTASAKLIWMVFRLRAHPGPVDPALLEARSGLSRPTVLKGLAQLAATGWYSAACCDHTAAIVRAPLDARVTVPGDLLADRRVGVQALRSFDIPKSEGLIRAVGVWNLHQIGRDGPLGCPNYVGGKGGVRCCLLDRCGLGLRGDAARKMFCAPYRLRPGWHCTPRILHT